MVSVTSLLEVTTLESKQKKEIESLEQENRSLRSRVDYLLRKLYGTSSEKVDADQLLLEIAALSEALQPKEAMGEVPSKRKRSKIGKGHGRARLPESMEERVVYIDPEEVLADPESYREIDSESSEQLDIVPPTLLKITTIRRKYVRIDDRLAPPIIANQPTRVIDKGLPTARLLAWIVVSKYCDHLPLYRQEKMFKRLGHGVSRKTMADWVGKVEFWLSGIHKLMLNRLLSGDYLQADETPIRYIDEDITRKGCKQGYLWALSAPSRDVVFNWSVTRAHAVATSLLEGYKGLLQSDGYQAYEKVEDATRIACMAHIRRKFEQARNEDVQFAAFVLLSIGKLYAIEEKLRDSQTSSKLREVRRASESSMVFERLGKTIRRRQARTLPSSGMGKAITYAIGQWTAMSRYLQYGQVEIDNNLMENAIRPSAIGKKNWLFIGHPKAGQRSAIIYSIIGSCERRGINPLEYLTDVLERLPQMQDSEQHKLTPENWNSNRLVKPQ